MPDRTYRLGHAEAVKIFDLLPKMQERTRISVAGRQWLAHRQGSQQLNPPYKD
jgi:hypothetical protein